jgi:hypothetical protein
LAGAGGWLSPTAPGGRVATVFGALVAGTLLVVFFVLPQPASASAPIESAMSLVVLCT